MDSTQLIDLPNDHFENIVANLLAADPEKRWSAAQAYNALKELDFSKIFDLTTLFIELVPFSNEHDFVKALNEESEDPVNTSQVQFTPSNRPSFGSDF